MHVPGWHEATKELQAAGKLQMLGILQEQHPDRARLFMQWKEMHWPLLVDSLNLLEVPYVPITLAIDEHGVIRYIHPQPADLQEFLARDYPQPAGAPPAATRRPDLGTLRGAASRQDTAEAWRAYANALLTWGNPEQLDEAIAAYQRALALVPGHGPTHFRLGVAYRRRYDSDLRRPGDFQRAVEQWAAALSTNPNQYIWRRRIQQYGPRLDKPYPFYDWVNTARQEIRARGQAPVELRVEPGGAEFAHPARAFATHEPPQEEPDPEGRIYRDQRGFVQVETVVVPPRLAPGQSARVHVLFRPHLDILAHWNNEVGDDLVFWVNPPAGWEVDTRALSVANPPQPVSQETRKVEFEVRSPENAPPGLITIPGYALYYVCEDVNGVCLYRRQDVTLELRVEKADR
ncbi:hypothetical protein MYX77_05540 [Acidobacteriia bacterium AH_259_A11_L15]|nr:hypothetical protein [Acidobacteriia bacterium AH_259_A11_L15]